jgi:hypothetical protein
MRLCSVLMEIAMTSFVDARDHASGAIIASLPASVLPPVGEPNATGLSHRLRAAFVAAGRLTVRQAEGADFQIREEQGDGRH